MWGSKKKRQAVVERYVAALNARDYEAIADLIHNDCCMIDSRGEYVEGRQIVLQSVRNFLALEPAFRVEVETIETNHTYTLMTGRTQASNPRLAVDTMWRARSTATHLLEWQSFAPTEPPPLARILAGDAAKGPKWSD